MHAAVLVQPADADAHGPATGGWQVKGTPARRLAALRPPGIYGALAAMLLAAVLGCDSPVSAPRGTGHSSPASVRSSAHPDPRATPGQSTPLAAGKPRATVPPSPRITDPLGAAASYVASRSGTLVAAVYDVGSGQTWTLGTQRPQAEASIVKLDILETLFTQEGDGPTGLPPSDQSLAQEMMEDSDNSAATSLWNAVGGPGPIQSFNTAAGLTDTAPSSCVVCPGFAWPGWGLTTTTPADQIVLLRELIKPSTLLTDAQRKDALQLMENVAPSQRWGVTGGVPQQATVALKDGWLPLNSAGTDWQINSIGWISGLGRDYLMAVLTTGNPDELYGIDTINQLSAMIWQGMR
jgi:beta-lactamase class A